MSMLAALQRPSLEASVPRTVSRDRLASAAALLSVSANASAITGAALGGAIAAGPGPQWVYGFDTVSFAVSFWLLSGCGRCRLPPPASAGRFRDCAPSWPACSTPADGRICSVPIWPTWPR